MYNYCFSSPETINCTFNGNDANKGGGMYNIDSSPTITNCIMWGDTAHIEPEIYNNIFSSPTVIYSNIKGDDVYPGEGNINDDPLFVTGPGGAYYLSQPPDQVSTSPCVDTGSDTAVNLGLDDKTTRTDGVPDSGIVDMGYHYICSRWAYPSIITGEGPGDRLGGWRDGEGVSETIDAADLDGDGFNDIIIGAPDGLVVSTGRVYIFYGDGTGISSTSAVNADTIITGELIGDEFGEFIEVVSDLNGDGIKELAVGAPRNDLVAWNAGTVYIFYGEPVTAENPEGRILSQSGADADIIIRGEYRDWIGETTVGDINGDGYNDLIIGGPLGVLGQNGRVFIFYGAPGGILRGSVLDADVIIVGECCGTLGYRLTTGKINQDNIDDLIITSPFAGTNLPRKTYIFYGRVEGIPDTLGEADAFLSSVEKDGYLGISMALFDANGDGFNDVVLGDFSPYNERGAIYIFHGGPSGISSRTTADADVTIIGESTGQFTNECFGWSLNGGGDVNGDGYSDLIIAAYHNDINGDNSGAAYIFYGGPGQITSGSAATEADILLLGENPLDNFGWVVRIISDINSDGLDDVLIGAPFNDNIGGEDAGAVYIYY
jgi:hypothetical protein